MKSIWLTKWDGSFRFMTSCLKLFFCYKWLTFVKSFIDSFFLHLSPDPVYNFEMIIVVFSGTFKKHRISKYRLSAISNFQYRHFNKISSLSLNPLYNLIVPLKYKINYNFYFKKLHISIFFGWTFQFLF